MTPKHVPRVISKISEKAGEIVNDEGNAASCHDSFGQQLANAYMAARELQKIMRRRTLPTKETYYLREDAVEIGLQTASRLTDQKNLAHSRA